MRTRRRGRWLPKQPRLGARMCLGTFFREPMRKQEKPDQVRRKGRTNQIGEGDLENRFSLRVLLPRLNSPHKPLQRNDALRVLLPLHAGKMLWFLLQ